MSRKRKTPEEYIQECKDKGYDLPIEDYVNSSTKITFRCKHGHTYKQYPCDHLRGHGCKYCADDNMRYIRRKTPEQYIKECKEKNVDLPIEDYKTKKIKIKFKCKKGHIYKQLPGSHLRGDGCKYCSNNRKKTQEQYYNECKDKGYDLPIEDYINDRTKIKHKCSKGHVYFQTPSSHLQGQGCTICKGSMKKTSEEYLKECKDKGLDLPIEGYKNNKTKIKHKCSKGHIYYQTPDMHIGRGLNGCPVCNESHGERYIRNYLDTHNIKYIPQKKFKNLKDKTYLSYDFYVPEYNTLIEYQGMQHYIQNEYFGGKKQFEKQQYHDNLKRQYAKDNGYKLLELKYTLNNQELVDRYLSRRIK